MTALTTPRNATLATGETVSRVGTLLTLDSTNNKVKKMTEGDIVIGVSLDESERDASGLVTGGLVGYDPVGGVLMVASKTGQTYTTGLLVYGGDADGLAYDDSNTNAKKLVGVYVGEGVVTTADGDLIPVATAGAATA
jgi:hypothetical protein